MKKLLIAGACAAGFMCAGPLSAQGQCVRFSPELPCSTLSISRTAARPAPKRAPPQTGAVPITGPRPTEQTNTPTDCGIVRQVDPTFHSAMPIVTPDQSTVRSVIKAIPTPACKQ
jgi:hypothetical protein